MVDGLARTLEGLDQQTYLQELIERVIVLDREVAAAEADELCQRYPSAIFLSSLVSNYFAAKNAGAAAATCDFIALLDSEQAASSSRRSPGRKSYTEQVTNAPRLPHHFAR